MPPKLKESTQAVKPRFVRQMLSLYTSCELEYSGVDGDAGLMLPSDFPNFEEALTQYLLFTYFSKATLQEKVQVILSNLEAIKRIYDFPKISVTQILIELESYGLGSIFERFDWWKADMSYKQYPSQELL